jgi:hypothetical protein
VAFWTPDDEFRKLVKDESKRPEPIAAHVVFGLRGVTPWQVKKFLF